MANAEPRVGHVRRQAAKVSNCFIWIVRRPGLHGLDAGFAPYALRLASRGAARHSRPSQLGHRFGMRASSCGTPTWPMQTVLDGPGGDDDVSARCGACYVPLSSSTRRFSE